MASSKSFAFVLAFGLLQLISGPYGGVKAQGGAGAPDLTQTAISILTQITDAIRIVLDACKTVINAIPNDPSSSNSGNPLQSLPSELGQNDNSDTGNAILILANLFGQNNTDKGKPLGDIANELGGNKTDTGNNVLRLARLLGQNNGNPSSSSDGTTPTPSTTTASSNMNDPGQNRPNSNGPGQMGPMNPGKNGPGRMGPMNLGKNGPGGMGPMKKGSSNPKDQGAIM